MTPGSEPEHRYTQAYAPAQLLRLAAEEPELLTQVARWQTLASYLLSRWRGQPSAPISNSEVGWTGLLNRRTLRLG